MSQPTQVQLREVTPQAAELHSSLATGPDLGDAQLNAQLKRQLGRMREGKRAFLLEWEGSKVPRGVTIEGKVIAWTQNGMVVSDRSESIGTYDRLVEFGGASGNHHKMLVFLS